MVSPQHECEETVQAGWHLMSICEDGSVGTSDIVIVSVVLLLVVAAGVGIWWWVRSRME